MFQDFTAIFPEGARIEKDDCDDLKAEVQNCIAVSVAFSSSYRWVWMIRHLLSPLKPLRKNKDEAHIIEGGLSALAGNIRSFEVTLEKAVIESTHVVSSKFQVARGPPKGRGSPHAAHPVRESSHLCRLTYTDFATPAGSNPM